MTLDKAIEIKEKYQYLLQDASIPEVLEADQLLIEAAKRFKALREVIRVPYTDPLPGEAPQ